MAHPFRSLLRDPRIAALWAGLAFNGFGGQLSGIAIIWLAIEVAGPNGSFVSTAQLAVTFLVSLGASAFVDRFTPRALMIAANLSSATILALTVSLGSLFGLNLWVLRAAFPKPPWRATRLKSARARRSIRSILETLRQRSLGISITVDQEIQEHLTRLKRNLPFVRCRFYLFGCDIRWT